ncbi:MAG: SsrA-binding protein SmpB [Pseudomonadales bacterium]
MTKKKPKPQSNTIALNKKAKFDYQIHERFEAGLALEGWEVKALRAGNCQLTDTYVMLKNGEAHLLGCNITPLVSASSHIQPDQRRTRKLLLHKKEIGKLIGATQRKGLACVALALYWKGNKAKCEIALASGKKQHDKRAAIKERDWNRDKARVMKNVAPR